MARSSLLRVYLLIIELEADHLPCVRCKNTSVPVWAQGSDEGRSHWVARESSNCVCLLLYYPSLLAEVLDGYEGHCIEVLDEAVTRDKLPSTHCEIRLSLSQLCGEVDVVEVIVESVVICLLQERGSDEMR